MDHFGPENGTSPNSRSALGISFKFCTLKEDNRYIEILLMAFPKKKTCFGQMDHSGPKMVHPHNSGFTVRIA